MSTQGATQSPEAPAHNSLMDATYRWQRHIYDATRKYFLFGRDRLIADLNLPQGGTVLELGCGTGRNAIETAQRFQGARVLAVDLSRASLAHAARKSRDLPTIEYAQADLLELGALDRRFDLIEAETALKDAEDNLRAVRENHQAAMREVAPLLNRLPTV